MTTITDITDIIRAKHSAGEDAYLWVCVLAGDVILWPSEAASAGDDGAHAIGRWQVDQATEDALIASGEVDETA